MTPDLEQTFVWKTHVQEVDETIEGLIAKGLIVERDGKCELTDAGRRALFLTQV